MRGRTDTVAAWGFLSPTLCLLGGLAVYPFAYAVYLSMTTAQVGVPGHFVGSGTTVAPRHRDLHPGRSGHGRVHGGGGRGRSSCSESSSPWCSPGPRRA